jgi:hypothetical protein
MIFLATFAIQAVVSLAISYGLVSYVPLDYFPDVIERNFGSTITTIQGADTISSSRSVINTNFANLNADKFETTGTTLANLTSAASLATVGTITSGTWNGSIVGATYGGTGSSTLSSNQVILGNGTGAVKVVSGFGSSGQFLTSGGSGTAPSWTSNTLDTSLNFNWTGTNYFKNFSASSTVANPFYLNGLAYDTPSTRPASSTVLMEDGNGHLTFNVLPVTVIYHNSNVSLTSSSAATTSLVTVAIPANTIGTASRELRVSMAVAATVGSNSGCWANINIGSGTATSTIAFAKDFTNGLGGGVVTLDAKIMSTTTATEYTTSIGTARPVGTTVTTAQGWSSFTAVNTAAPMYLDFGIVSPNGATVCNLLNISVERLTS